MQDLKDAVAFVTGGASGIGLSIAQALKAHGARVAIADVDGAKVAEVAHAEGFLPIQLDVSDRAAVGEALARTEAELGPLRILVNNAGVGILGLVEDAGFQDWDWALSVNLMGVINGLVPGLARIKAHGMGGHIINTASMAALRVARPKRGLYGTTKAAIVALSEHMQLELQDSNIGVSVLCPGEVKTNIVASGRSRPAHLREGSKLLDFEAEAAKRDVDPNWLEVDIVGRLTVDAILNDRFYIMTHPDTLPYVRERHAAIEAAMVESESLLTIV